MASLFGEAKWFKNFTGTKPCNFSMNDESEWRRQKKRPLWQGLSFDGDFMNPGKKNSQTVMLPGNHAGILQHRSSPAERECRNWADFGTKKAKKCFQDSPWNCEKTIKFLRQTQPKPWTLAFKSSKNKKLGSRPIWSWLKTEFQSSEGFFQLFWHHVRREDARPPRLCLRSQFFCLWQSLKGAFEFQSLSS